MTVGDLFELNRDYSQIAYLAGAGGAGNRIEDIDILEIPDGMYWVKEGDFIVTMGYFLTTSSVSFENFVRLLIFNGAAGLGVKLGRFFNEIPSVALEMAEKNHFPVINYPLHMGYKSITRPVMRRLESEDSYNQYTLGTYREELWRILENGYDIGKIADHLKRYIHHDICVVWGNSGGLICSTAEHGWGEIRQMSDNGKEGPLNVYPIKVRGQLLASLYLIEREKREFKSIDELLIRETIPHILTYLLLETRLGQGESHSKEDFCMEILDGKYDKDREGMFREARRLNMDTGKRWHLAGVDGRGLSAEETDRVCRKISFYMDVYKFDYVLFERKKRICLMVEAEERRGGTDVLRQRFPYMAGDIKGILKGKQPRFCVSKGYKSLSELGTAWDELLYLFSKEKEGDGILFYEDFQMEHLLAEMRRQTVMKKICSDLDEAIGFHDENGQIGIYETINAMVISDFNLIRAADSMFLHRNTLYKRVKKIEKLLGIDMSDGETRLMLQLFVKTKDKT